MKHILADIARATGHVILFVIFWSSFWYLAWYFNAAPTTTSASGTVFWLVVDVIIALLYIGFYTAIKATYRIEHEKFLAQQAERDAEHQARNDKFGQQQADYYGHDYFWLGHEYSPSRPRIEG